MRTILGLLAVVVVAVLAVLAFQWWNGNKEAVSIVYPAEGTSLAGNTVPVRLNTNQDIKNKLNAPGGQTEIVTYLDDKEVGRSKSLDYNLTSVPPGQHRLSIGMIDGSNGQNGVNLNLMPKSVSFILGGGSGANASPSNLPSGTSNSPYNSEANAVPPQPTATPVAYQAPAPVSTPVPVVVGAPATGMGGMSRQVIVPQAQTNIAPAPVIASNSQLKAGQLPQSVVTNGSQSQLVLASTQVNREALINADRAKDTSSQETGIDVAFRWIGAFYLAAFIVALGLVLVVQKRRS